MLPIIIFTYKCIPRQYVNTAAEAYQVLSMRPKSKLSMQANRGELTRYMSGVRWMPLDRIVCSASSSKYDTTSTILPILRSCNMQALPVNPQPDKVQRCPFLLLPYCQVLLTDSTEEEPVHTGLMQMGSLRHPVHPRSALPRHLGQPAGHTRCDIQNTQSPQSI